jgi:carboxymethylenebutenolidase
MCHNESTAPEPGLEVRETRHELGDVSIPTVIFEPAHLRSDELPVVVMATDIYGINDFYRYLGARIARTGYRVAVPDLFHRIGPAADGSRDAALDRRRLLDDVQAVADLEAVIGSLNADRVSPAGISYALIGFCLGGSLALLTASAHPEQATITYYAFPRGAPGARVSAAEPLSVAAAIHGPVLAFWGRRDYIDPREVAELQVVLDVAPGESEVVWYERAGHSFLAGLTTQSDESEAAEDSWRRSMSFLARHLLQSGES